MTVRYQVTKYGTGFRGKGSRWLGSAIAVLRRKLRKIEPPYHFQGQPKHTYTRPDVLREAKRRIADHKTGHKEVIFGANYDEPGFSIRSADIAPAEHPYVTAAKRYLENGQPYLLGGVPPGPCDCSGLTMKAVADAEGTVLPHSAREQGHMGSMRLFRDAGDLQSGDFIFYHFTNRVGYSPDDYDHVALFVRQGTEIGSRPSTNGVGYHVIDTYAVVTYGRLGA